MQDRGWLEQQECDFLKAVQTIGAYEFGLRPLRRQSGGVAPILDPEQVAHALFSLYAMSDVDMTITKVPSISQLAAGGSPMHVSGLSVMALWSAGRCRIALDERSHITPSGGQTCTVANITLSPAPGAIDYGFGPDRILFLHRYASFAPEGTAPPDGIVVFTAAKRSVMPAVNARRGRAIVAA
jgi:hypothetical protein